MKIEAGIFDLGGVVVKNSEVADIKDSLKIDSRKLWAVVKTLAADVQTGKVTEDELLEFLGNELGLVEIPYDLFSNRYRERFGLIDGSVDLINRIRGKGIATTALSNTIPSHERVMRDNGVFELFDHEVLSHSVGLRKPDPRIYEMALEITGFSPSQTFFTDDIEKNIRAAEKLGIEVILFESPAQLREDLGKLGLVS